MAIESKLREIRDKYNQVVDTDKWEDFWSYRPLRITVSNAAERYKNSSTPVSEKLEPIFESDPSGDYFAIEIEGSKDFAVVPRPRMAYQNHSHEAGAMGEVFKTSEFNPRLRYHRVKVVIPALFESDSAKQRWKLIERGELDLGQGE